jgi:peptidoglycan/LPS O-acetylase OafA/YrhL
MFGLNIILLSFIWVAGFVLARFPASHAKIANHIAVLFVVHFLVRHLIQFAFSLKHHQLEQWVRNDLIGIIFSGICLGATYYVIIHNNKIPVFSSKWKKLFNLLGNISYPLYLIHSTLIKFCKEMNITNWILLSLVCITGAWVIYYFFDFYSKKREIKASTLATLKSVEV